MQKKKRLMTIHLLLFRPVAEFLEGGNMLSPQISSSATVMLIRIDDITSYYTNLTPHQVGLVYFDF